MSSDRLDTALLAELRALDKSRIRYQLEHPGALLEQEDPDVRRLIEALAYSGVRTRQAVQRNLQATWRRLLSGYFSFLLQPLPAMAIAQALVTARMTETTVLPRGTMLRLTTLDGFVGHFQTLAELRVIPMTMTRCDILLRAQGFRLALKFVSQYPRGDEVGMLRMQLQYLDNYLAAMRVQHNLQTHLQRCIAVYDSPVSPDTEGPACEVIFGSYYEEPHDADTQNPLEQARAFFHFPEQDLAIHVRVPPSPRKWSQLSLCFDLDADWPQDPPIYGDLFRLFAVPIRNLRRSFAEPIECDGTRDQYPIRYLTDDRSFALHRPHGIYRSTPDGMEPLRAAALGDIRPTYELEEPEPPEPGGSGHNFYLTVRMPEAFAKPQRLLVDASWYQPEFAQHAVGPLKVELMDRSILGLDWRSVGSVRGPLLCPLRQDPDRLLYLLSLKMKPVLEREELLELLAMFGSLDSGAYRELPQQLREMAVEVVPDGRMQGAGIRHVYHVMMAPHRAEDAPLLGRFLARLGTILDAWDYEARVELRAHSGNGPLPVLALSRREGDRPR